ncbi:MAG: T9SS type A sorting domain-containing protein [Bacteroidota bacterium]
MKNIFIFIIIILSCLMANAQEVVSSAGETQSASGYEISWTIGEPVIETVTDGTNTLTQGFHQSKLTVTAINEFPVSEIGLKVYPNPTENFVHIHFSELIENVHYALYNNAGSLIENNTIRSTKTKLNLKQYASGQYILKLTQDTNQPLQTFKIIKK